VTGVVASFLPNAELVGVVSAIQAERDSIQAIELTRARRGRHLAELG